MKRSLFFLLTLVATLSASAHNFEVDGIYYVMNYDGVSVSYKGTSYSAYSNEYSGAVNIPPSVTYSGETYSVTAIGSDAFFGCRGLTSVTIPNSVTSIGSEAFGDCSGLTSVTIGGSVKTIGNYAFSGCSGLKTVNWNAKNCADFGYDSSTQTYPLFVYSSGITTFNFGNEVEKIPAYLCKGLSGLTSVTIGNSVTSIGSAAFSGCSGLASVTIPDSVTSIGSSAFEGCRGLTSVTIPNSVTSIGSAAFSGCSGLTKVEISDISAWCGISFGGVNANPLSYAKHLYLNGNEIKDLVIPDSVTSIGAYAFDNCNGLTSVTIGNNVTSLGKCTFRGCRGLTTVNWNAKNCADFTYDSTPFHYYYYGSSNDYTLTGITTFNFGNEVERIPAYLCRKLSGLTSVTIPNSVTSIGDYAFNGCSKLTGALTIPDSVTSIGSAAFSGCSGLTGTLTIPNSVTSIGESAFKDCNGLKKVNWNAKNCADFTYNSTPFHYHLSPLVSDNYTLTGITTFNFGNEVERIPAYLCKGLSGLTSVTIGNSVTSIGNGAFVGCSGLTTVNWNAKNCADFTYNSTPFHFHYYDSGSSSDYSLTGIRTFNFGNKVERIPAYLCYKLSGLTSVTIGNSVTSIGISAFYGCSGLTKVEISDLAAWCRISFGGSAANPLSYAHHLFLNDSEIKELVIPNSVTSIRSSAFNGCSGLTSITLPNSVTSIGSSAFEGCNNIDILNINSNACASISYFPASKTKVRTLVLGNTVTSIGSSAFEGCEGLTSVTLGFSIKTIGSNAFKGCKNLSSFINLAQKPQQISSNVFNSVNKTKCSLYIQPSSYNRYKAADVWKDFSISLVSKLGFVIDGIQYIDICNDVMAVKNYNVGDVVIPEKVVYNGAEYNVTSICSEAFWDNVIKLKTILIPKSIVEIGEYAFTNNVGLTTVTNYAETPQKIDSTVFYGVNISSCKLNVWHESINKYKNTNIWKNFQIGDLGGVEGVEVDEPQKEIEGYYNLQGIRLNEPVPGQVNIVRYTDGTTKKIVVK